MTIFLLKITKGKYVQTLWESNYIMCTYVKVGNWMLNFFQALTNVTNFPSHDLTIEFMQKSLFYGLIFFCI
jgi:hypothetical protein